MQMVIAIPYREELKEFGGAQETVLRDVSGVPLLVRVIATGVRAGANRVLVIHREGICAEIEITLRKNKLLSGFLTLNFTPWLRGCFADQLAEDIRLHRGRIPVASLELGDEQALADGFEPGPGAAAILESAVTPNEIGCSLLPSTQTAAKRLPRRRCNYFAGFRRRSRAMVGGSFR